jgi:mono/diheme cytochrome c family protein
MRGGHLKTLTIAMASALFLTACPGDDPAPDRPAADPDRPAPTQPGQPGMAMDLPEGVTQEEFDEGRRLFTGQGGCHACHGPQATGTQLGPNLTDDQWLNVSEPSMDEVMRVIREGVQQPVQYPAPMPPMGGARLTDDQIHALAAYVIGIN